MRRDGQPLKDAMTSQPRRKRRYVIGVLLLSCAAAAAVLPAWSASPSLVTITEAPPASWAHTEATFRFTSKATSIACRRDRLRYEPCRNKVKYSGMRPGRHSFMLRVRYKGRTTFKRHAWTVTRTSTTRPAARAPAPGVNAATIQRNPNAAAPLPRTLVLDEEFNGTTLDLASWLPYNAPGHAGYGLRRPSALSLDGLGHLVVTGRMQHGRIVAGGMAHRLNFTYGRVEFRVKTEVDPTGTMSGVVLTWPKRQWSPEYTENDMYETGPRVSNRRAFDTFIHFGTNTDWQKLTTHDIDPSRWHTVAMEWYPNLLEIYVDGLLTFSVGDAAVIPDILHHVCIQLDARANRKLKRPVRMLVDYVRVYQ
jgi:hypothetical protein